VSLLEFSNDIKEVMLMIVKEAVREKDRTIDIKREIDKLVDKAQTALEKFMEFDQEKIDNIVKEMAMAGLDEHMRLAKMAV